MNTNSELILEGEIDTTTDEGKLDFLLHLLVLDTLEERLVHGVNILREQGDTRDESVIRDEISGWLTDIELSLEKLQSLNFPEPGLTIDES